MRLFITALRIQFFFGFKRSVFSARCILPSIGILVVLLMQAIILFHRRNQEWVDRFFAVFHGWATLSIMVPLWTLYLSISAIADDRERGSLVYLTSRPIFRFVIPMGRGFGSALASILYSMVLVVGSTACFNALSIAKGDGLTLDDAQLPAFAAACIVSSLCFTGLGTFLGSFLKKGLLFGVGLVLGWEVLVGSLMVFNKITGLNSLLATDMTRRIAFLMLPGRVQDQIRGRFPLLGNENISSLLANSMKYFLAFFILGLLIFSLKEHPYRRKEG